MYKNLKIFIKYIPLFMMFNRSNLIKIMYIFILGLIFRVLLNNIYIISDYLSQSYFICYSLLIIIIHELIDYFNINSFNGKIFMASNINKTEPYRELGLSNKSSSKNSPINSYILPTNRRITEL